MATHRVALPSGEEFSVAPGERILAAARRAGVWLPFECGWGSCGTCKATLVEGEVELLFPEAPAIKPRDARRRRILTCQTTPITDVVLKPTTVSSSPPEPLAVEDRVGTVVANLDLGPGLRRLEVELDRPVRYRAGQYAIVEPAPGLRRCYSMATPPGSGVAEIAFVYRRYPGRPGSSALWALRPGDPLPLELPYGAMWIRDDEPTGVVLVAGGTGVSPILAMVGDLAARGVTGTVHVVYGARRVEELVCADDLVEGLAALPRGRITLVVEDPPPGWSGPVGTVVDALEPDPDLRYYVAGPPPMVDAVLAHLDDGGVGLDRIAYDSFG
ncbi:MAG TPA: 2Fe-2S iron-sulfur cluster binding domain-containing protein [Actinobacteria bacterium]|nr:2Fe-2S iron-sulfur cluster binding domain-containing protein [Actinomycetota bacterium]